VMFRSRQFAFGIFEMVELFEMSLGR
jgi:hypothetical protein